MIVDITKKEDGYRVAIMNEKTKEWCILPMTFEGVIADFKEIKEEHKIIITDTLQLRLRTVDGNVIIITH